MHHFKTSFDDVSDYCNNFTDAIDEGRRICRLWGVDPTFQFQDYVWKKTKRHFDELAEDTFDERRTALPNHGVQLRVIDMVTSQLTQQFTALNNIAAKFSVISQVSSHPYQNMTSYHKSQLYRKNTAVIEVMHFQYS